MKPIIFSILLFLAGIALFSYIVRADIAIAADDGTDRTIGADTVATVRTSGPSPRKNDGSLLMSIYFSTGDFDVDIDQTTRLHDALSCISNRGTTGFILDGYADSSGSGYINNDFLALNRSFSVYTILTDEGIEKNKILMRSFGACPDDTSSGSARKVNIFTSEAFN